jgi:hypothetical protein
MMTPGDIARRPDTVTLASDGKTVATQTVTGSHIYRFVVAPGAYQVLSSGRGGQPPASVHVDAGQLVRVDLFSNCL